MPLVPMHPNSLPKLHLFTGRQREPSRHGVLDGIVFRVQNEAMLIRGRIEEIEPVTSSNGL